MVKGFICSPKHSRKKNIQYLIWCKNQPFLTFENLKHQLIMNIPLAAWKGIYCLAKYTEEQRKKTIIWISGHIYLWNEFIFEWKHFRTYPITNPDPSSTVGSCLIQTSVQFQSWMMLVCRNTSAVLIIHGETSPSIPHFERNAPFLEVILTFKGFYVLCLLSCFFKYFFSIPVTSHPL